MDPSLLVAVVLLFWKNLNTQRSMGPRIYTELVGYTANLDDNDMVAPLGVSGEHCMKIALENAKMNMGNMDKPVEYINMHGMSTPVGDIMEIGAIKNCFTEIGYQPWVGSMKSLSGHALGAAGVHEAIYTILMMNNNYMAESANIKELIDEAEGMNILRQRRDGEFKRAMSNSFGFGGTNCALIFDKYEE